MLITFLFIFYKSIEADFQSWQDELLDQIMSPKLEESGKNISPLESKPSETAKDLSGSTNNIGGASCVAETSLLTTFYPLSSSSPILEGRSVAATLKAGGFYKGNTMAFPILSKTVLNPSYPDSMLEMNLGIPSPLDIPNQLQPEDEIKTGSPSPLYQTGDHIGIYPQNSSEMVSRLASRFGLPLDDQVGFNWSKSGSKKSLPFPDGLTVRQILRDCLDFQSIPKPAMISTMALNAQDPDQRKKLETIARNPELFKDEIWKPNRHFIDLAEEFSSVNLPFAALIQGLSPLQPRYYSIASSSLKFPQEIHLTYRWVHYFNSIVKEERQGVSTRYLKNLDLNKEKSQEVYGFLRTSSFRLPVDPKTPIVMIAGGSGIAPLKAFLEERLFLSTTKNMNYGPGIFFFGVRSPQDLVYSSMVEECLKSGAISSAHISFSSPPTKEIGENYQPKFVSQDVADQGLAVWKAISDGGYIYLCGGASAFAATCVKSLKNIIQTHGKLDSQGAEDYIASMIRQKRYQEDLSD